MGAQDGYYREDKDIVEAKMERRAEQNGMEDERLGT